MAHLERLNRKPLGEILVAEGLLDRETVDDALRKQKTTKRLLSDILLDAGLILETDLAALLVQQQQVPYVDLSAYNVRKELIQELPARLLHRAALVPLERFGDQIVFACQELPTWEIVESLRRYSPDGHYYYVCLVADVKRVLGEYAPLPEEPEEEEPAAAQPVDPDDDSWKSLFDSANNAVMADIKDDPDDGNE
ncbi:MAG: hypothetical protein ACE10D_13350 [Planctomycetota bacterium]|nr:hypothetical protein [Planctomycetota bacterium]